MQEFGESWRDCDRDLPANTCPEEIHGHHGVPLSQALNHILLHTQHTQHIPLVENISDHL